MNHAAFILEQLQRVGHRFTPMKGSSGWMSIECVFLDKHKGGVDKTPSLRVRLEGGNNTPAKCWSCDTLSSWNAIAKILNVSPIPGSDEDDGSDKPSDARREFASLAESFDKLEDKESLGLPKSMIERWTGDFVRDGKVLAHEDVLLRLPTYRWYDPGKSGGVYITERIMWPIMIRGKSHGYTGRALDPDVKHRWQNSDNFKATQLLFPYDLLPKTSVAVLVEGPTSALRLVDRRIPAVCIFGANNWDKDHKIPLLVQKGVQTVVMAFDGDKAGNKARARIEADLMDHFEVHHFPVPPKKDPANMKSAYVRALRDHVRSVQKEYANAEKRRSRRSR